MDEISIKSESLKRRLIKDPRMQCFLKVVLYMSPKARDIKERIIKWDLIKLKSFCMTKGESIKMTREPTVWENLFTDDTLDNDLISKIF